MSGKGSAPRPKSVDDETFSANWDRAFGKRDNAEREEDRKQDESNVVQN